MEEELELAINSLSISEKDEDDYTHAVYFGWFFSEDVCQTLKDFSEKNIKTCLDNVPQFERFLRKACEENNCKDPLKYYRYPAKTKKQKRCPNFHVTSKYCGRIEQVCLEYGKLVSHLLNITSPINIIGLFFTKNTCGYRVKLTKEQQLVFDEHRVANTTTQDCIHSTNEIDSSEMTLDKKSDLLLSSCTKFSSTIDYTCDDARKGNKKLKNKKAKVKEEKMMTCKEEYPGLSFCPQTISFQPCNSRAHITVGVGIGVQAVQVGEDLLDIIDLEKRSSTLFYTDYEIENIGVLRQFGRLGDAFVLYFNEKIIVNAEFKYKV